MRIVHVLILFGVLGSGLLAESTPGKDSCKVMSMCGGVRMCGGCSSSISPP